MILIEQAVQSLAMPLEPEDEPGPQRRGHTTQVCYGDAVASTLLDARDDASGDLRVRGEVVLAPNLPSTESADLPANPHPIHRRSMSSDASLPVIWARRGVEPHGSAGCRWAALGRSPARGAPPPKAGASSRRATMPECPP